MLILDNYNLDEAFNCDVCRCAIYPRDGRVFKLVYEKLGVIFFAKNFISVLCSTLRK